MILELRNIKSFLKVAEFENFSKAAEALGYAQSTITIQIQQLEQELGVPLFDRIGKRVVLSERGRHFRSYANEMLRIEAEALEAVSENDMPKGILRIGITETISDSFFPALLEEYLRKYPAVQIEIACGLVLDLYDKLEKGELDLIFLLDRQAYRPALQTVFSLPTAVPFLAHKTHPLANQENVSPERLAQETLILTEEKNNYRQTFDELAIVHGVAFEKIQVLSNLSIILYFLKKNLGVTFTPKYALPSNLAAEDLALFSVEGFEITLDLQILYHRQKYVSPAMRRFTETVEAFFADKSINGHF